MSGPDPAVPRTLMVDRTDCAGTRAVRTAPEMMTRTYWSLPSKVLPVPGGASTTTENPFGVSESAPHEMSWQV